MTDDTRRHWHGTAGNRHEHQNPWVRGGALSNMMRPVWAPTDTKQERRGSETSTSSANSDKNNPPSVGERRRSSGPLFQSLTTQKRNSGDASMIQRRASWNEQAEKGGFFSRWWDGYTRGQ